MRVEDLIIEVRDRSLTRQGVIRAKDVELEATIEFNGVGSWLLRIPGQHHLADHLALPGSGILVTNAVTGKVLFSGPMTSSKEVEDTQDGAIVTLEASGVTDDVLLSDRLAYTDPTVEDLAEEAENVYYVKTDTSENLLHHFTSVNVGPEAVESRRKDALLLEGNAGRGSEQTMEVRYTNLLELLQKIAQADDLGFSVRQQGANLAFRTYSTEDRSRTVRLSVHNKRLKSSSVQIEPPGATRVIVARGDEKVGYIPVDNEVSLEAESLWDRRIEAFTTGNTRNPSELTEVGLEYLTEDGFTNIAAQAVAVDHEQMTYGIDWELGDKVTVEIGGDELVSQVTGFSLIANSRDGLRFGMTLGDATGFDLTSSILKKLDRAARRIAALERIPPVNEVALVPESAIFNFPTASTVWECSHNFDQLPVQVITLDSSGEEIVGDVDFVTPNTVRIHWYFPMSGSARIQR